MKTKLFSLLSALLIGGVATSQSFDLGLRSGYQCGTGATIGTSYTGTSSGYTRSTLTGSYGRGLPIQLVGNFWPGNNIGVYGMLFMLCGWPSVTEDYTDQFGTQHEEVKAKQVGFGTGVSFRTGSEGMLNGYARVGVGVPIISSYVRTSQQTFATIPLNWTERTTLYPGLGCDFESGVTIGLGDRIDLTAGIFGRALSQCRKQTEVTTYTVGGVDLLSTLPESQRLINFLKTIDENSNASGNSNFDSGLPSDQLTTRDPFSSWGVMFGGNLKF